jgi:hypothetical protein
VRGRKGERLGFRDFLAAPERGDDLNAKDLMDEAPALAADALQPPFSIFKCYLIVESFFPAYNDFEVWAAGSNCPTGKPSSMSEPNPNRFSGRVTVFHERPLPERATLVGYAALIDSFLTTSSALSVRFPAGYRLSAAATAPSIRASGAFTRPATSRSRLSKGISPSP